MCVIIVKEKGTQFPSSETIRKCLETNPDGSAVAWNEDGKLKRFATMDTEKMLAFYTSLAAGHDFRTTGMVFHARIATCGSKKVENCHLWMDEAELLAFAHNGMLTSVKAEDDMTDSETFFRTMFLPAVKAGCSAANLRALCDGVGRSMSRFAVINKAGNIFLAGRFEPYIDENTYCTILCSNLNFTRQRTTPHNTGIYCSLPFMDETDEDTVSSGGYGYTPGKGWKKKNRSRSTGTSRTEATGGSRRT